MKTTLTSLMVLAGLCLMAWPKPSLAAEACAADAKKYCAGIEKGGGRIMKCLKAHQADVSDACKERIAAAANRAKQNACAADVEKYCKGVEVGEGRVAKCLKQHEADLSAACKEQRAANRRKHGGASAPKPTAAAKP